MRKSLRWRLQIWHALILLVVVAGFGVLLYGQLRAARLDEIDAELASAASVLEGVLRIVPPPFFDRLPADESDRRPPPRRPPPGRAREERPGPPAYFDERGPRHAGPPFGPRPEGEEGEFGPPSREEHAAQALELPFSFQERHAHLDQPPFFVVWRPDGSVLKSSGIDPALIPPFAEDSLHEPSARPTIVQRRLLRELWTRGPGQSLVVVGRSIEHELQGIHRLGWQMLLSGTAVFGVGLLGGWWLSSSAIRPIAAMSETAATISADNLSRRIDLTGIDTELGELGATLNEMLDRLEASFRQQTQFTSDASHELRTPLAVILSHIELALSQPRSPEEYQETLTTCQRASQRVRVLVDDLLTLARADAGRLELRPSPVDLLQTAQDAVVMLAPLAERQGVKLSTDGRAVQALVDPTRLAQVVTNLVSNAILYNRREGQVTLTVAEDDGAAVLKVADTGIGIAAHDLPHLFDRFYRVDRARSRDSGGSGLGLAISQSIVAAHAGTLTATSELGVGTTFVVRLPKA
jgi:two-component system, OmpR family, sensor kinase